LSAQRYSISTFFQASPKHFQQCTEFPLLLNRGFGPLAVTVWPLRSPGGPPLPFAPPCNQEAFEHTRAALTTICPSPFVNHLVRTVMERVSWQIA
jgi:hypothetical protein